jgi:hypothetical protein
MTPRINAQPLVDSSENIKIWTVRMVRYGIHTVPMSSKESSIENIMKIRLSEL